MLGDNLKQLRKDKGLTQQEMANLFGISRGTYAHYEINRREPDAETLSKLADFFGVTVDDLLGRESPQNPVTGEPLTVREITDLKKFIDQPNLSYDGTPVTEEEKEQLKKAMEFVFFQANEIAKKRKEATKKKKKLSN